MHEESTGQESAPVQEPEQAMKETAEQQKTVEPSGKKTARDLFITKKPNEYVGLIFSYGGYFPVADYGGRYRPAHLISGAVAVYYVNFFGISPEFHVRYAEMKSNKSSLSFSSTISTIQFFPALVYRYDITLPGSFPGPITPYARLYDGISKVEYKNSDPLDRLFGQGKILEYINIFGVSAGCTLTLYRGLFAGLEFGYSIIATAGSPLQAMSFSVVVGYKFL
ncbi:MAG: hypothetical protein JW807_00695 [Spirochaetes bacterium]|nr:hypothetical protein [Spirochaetota bacterium]